MKRQPDLLGVFSPAESEKATIGHFEKTRWPHGVECLRCDSGRVFRYKTHGKTGKPRQLYQCVDCRYNFSVTTGTLFHDSHLPLSKWFQAIALIYSSEKSVSARQLQRELNLGSYKTAWNMKKRLRQAML